MKYEIIEKVLIRTSLNSITQSKFFQKKKRRHKSGFLYTSYRGYDEKIVIGFTNSIENLIPKQRDRGFNLVGRRSGVKNDEKILKDTLLELGHLQSSFDGSYKYSLSLLRHLEILGWPIEGIYNSYKNRIYTNKSKK